MADPTFDGANKTITLGVGVTAVNAQQELYSAWKRWVKNGDGSKYDEAFDNSFGGNDVGGGKFVAAYFIFRNDLGWRIVPDDANHELTIEGNLYAAAPTTDTFTIPAGRTVGIFLDRSVNAQALGGIPSAADTAVAVWAEIIRTGDTSGDLLLRIEKLLRNKEITDPTTGVATLYDDDGTSTLLTRQMYEGTGTSQTYRGDGAERRERYE